MREATQPDDRRNEKLVSKPYLLFNVTMAVQKQKFVSGMKGVH